ncbi:hypothetical protein MML48_9g00016511 [Holotrichia oblita]|uniref:Uncharacterized protein n=1 Tax=Holotrichia oblita TaxID=644536 RepID=A0ACB9SJE9_HOLOL|nr:hypothetical protein MML48_9g00016511 [Holotrichia oblita]
MFFNRIHKNRKVERRQRGTKSIKDRDRKAPTPPTPTAPIIPVQPQNEEKTLVYVLVKKPEDAPEIHIPTPAPTQPSKPEVYFIRYKTQKEEGYPDRVPAPAPQYGAPPSAPSTSYGAP